MLTVALTGATGFIGKQFLEVARGRFNVRVIGRSGTDGAGHAVSLSDAESLASVLAGCDALVHCAHTSAPEERNAVWAEALCTAAVHVGVSKIVALGTFATYDNVGSAITESTRPCGAQIPYVTGKRALEAALLSQAVLHPSLLITFLQPAIVTGPDGSWDRLARRLQKTGQIFLPDDGNGTCNTVDVAVVAEAIARALEMPVANFGTTRFVKALLSGREQLTWAAWLTRNYNIPVGKIASCNQNTWAEGFKRNILLAVRYSRPGAVVFRQLARKKGAAPDAAPASPGSEMVPPAPSAVFVPEGLDRMTMACRAVVIPDRATALGLID